jgi:capsular exopolysaccharide synthesis family protein
MKILDELRRDSPMGSEIHKLESRLRQLARRDNLKLVSVTSALRGEGKSTTVAYLAAALAMDPGRRILAVDLDFRRPTLKSHFEVTNECGMVELLRRECTLEHAITNSGLPGLDLIMTDTADPRLLHDSKELAKIFQALRERYDLVLLDLPALVPVPDAASLLPHTDGVILVVMAGLTTKHHLTAARELCLGVGANILGFVVSNIQEAAPEYLDVSYYQYSDVKRNGKPEGRQA